MWKHALSYISQLAWSSRPLVALFIYHGDVAVNSVACHNALLLKLYVTQMNNVTLLAIYLDKVTNVPGDTETA